jgi:hypothetical protein
MNFRAQERPGFLLAVTLFIYPGDKHPIARDVADTLKVKSATAANYFLDLISVKVPFCILLRGDGALATLQPHLSNLEAVRIFPEMLE